MHLDPGLYLYEFGQYGQAHLMESGLYQGKRPMGTSEAAQSPSKAEQASAEDSNEKRVERQDAQAASLRYSLCVLPDVSCHKFLNLNSLKRTNSVVIIMSYQIHATYTHRPDDLAYLPRVANRAISADQQLHASRERVRLPARRSASFMLSRSTSAAGRMSPMLASAAALRGSQSEHLARPDDGGDPGTGRPLLGDSGGGGGIGQRRTSCPVTALSWNDKQSSVFMSMSPTMQWLQVPAQHYVFAQCIHVTLACVWGLAVVYVLLSLGKSSRTCIILRLC